MVDGGKNHIVSNQSAISDGNASLILKMTAGIDEHIFSKCNVFSEVGVKGWKQAKCVVDRFSCQLCHNLPNFFRRTRSLTPYSSGSFPDKLSETAPYTPYLGVLHALHLEVLL